MPRRFPSPFLELVVLALALASPARAQLCNARTTLHDQVGYAGTVGVPITDFLPTSTVGPNDSMAVDDVWVPANTVWYVDRVRVVLGSIGKGVDANQGTFHLSIYLEEEGLPGPVVCEHRDLAVDLTPFPPDGFGRRTVTIPLPQPCTLCAGMRYWVGLQRVESTMKAYTWIQRTDLSDQLAVGQPALWQNPGGGLGTSCASWQPAAASCHVGDGISPDLAFALEGVSRTVTADMVPGDLNGDRCADLVFERSDLTGLDLMVWVMHGSNRVAEVKMNDVSVAPNTHLVGVQDLTGDGQPDLVLQERNEPGSTVSYLPLVGGVPVGTMQPISGSPPPLPAGHAVHTTGHFSARPEPDLVCHGPQGTVIIWDLHGVQFYQTIHPDPASTVDTNWEVQGAGDFNGDDATDLLFVNHDSGRLVIWELNKERVRQSAGFTVPNQPDPVSPRDWHLAAVADFGLGPDSPADAAAPVCGSVDLVFQNETTGELRLWNLNFNRERTAQVSLGPTPAGWTLAGPR